MLITVTHGAAAIPDTIISPVAWAKQERDEWDTEQKSRYRHLLELMFYETKIVPSKFISRPSSDMAALAIPISIDKTQAQLAGTAISLLYEDLGNIKIPSLAAYASTSVDEEFFSSVLGRLAGQFGFAKVPHFGIGQLQGAAMAAAFEISESMLIGQDQATVLFVAAEKWPAPSQRIFTDQSVLADGAAALWMTNKQNVTGLAVIGTINKSCDPFVEMVSPGVINQESILDALKVTIKELIDRHRADIQQDLLIWLPSGFGFTLDTELVGIFGGKLFNDDCETHSIRLNYCSAAGPCLVSKVLQAINTGDILPDTFFISWGISYGGAIGVTLFKSTMESKQ